VDSLILVERDPSTGEEKVSARSAGALRMARYLGGPWTLARALAIVPPFLRDWAYDLFARFRYRLFGRYDRCPVPSPEQRARFID
jgi:predicted DCC family thiol-disulfide oxidoreductase YuxK